MESDEEEVKDEGYHSQNRGSSEVPASFPGSTQGASGGSEDAVEMTEIKTETVALVPPPRNINDYRKDPCSRQASNSSVDSKGHHKSTSEITYIEVESVPIPKEECQVEIKGSLEESIPEAFNIDETKGDISVDKISEKENQKNETGTGYEVPLQMNDKVVLEPDSSETEKKHLNFVNDTKNYESDVNKLDSSEYVECDNIPETKQYVNMDHLNMPEKEASIKFKENEYVNENAVSASNEKLNEESNINYANLDALDKHINTQNVTELEFDFTASEEPHDYMNLSALEGTKEHDDDESKLTNTEMPKVEKTSSDDSKDSETNKHGTSETQKGKSDEAETQNLETANAHNKSLQQQDLVDTNTEEKDTDKHSMTDTAFERLTLKENNESDSDVDNDKIHLVNVGDSKKLVAKTSKKIKGKTQKSSDESDYDSDSPEKKVTDQTKLI